MSILQISKIQQRSGNLVDLPQLDEAEFGWASDQKRLFIGKTVPNENIEVLTSYSNISFSQLDGAAGNLNINPLTVANGQVLTFDGEDWVNRGGNAGGLITLGNVANVKITGGAVGYILETDGTGNLSWTPKSAVVASIENVTKADPAVVTTSTENFFVSGTYITITEAQGMTELNGNSYYLKVIDNTSFELYANANLTGNIDSTGYNAYAYTSVSATSASSNRVTMGNTAQFSVNSPIMFTGNISANGGGNVTNLSANTIYYIKSIPTGTQITVSDELINNVAGNTLVLGTVTGLSANVYQMGGRVVSNIGGGGTGNMQAAGTNTMVQFNNNNVLGATADFTFDYAGLVLTVNGNANVANLNATGLVSATQYISNVAVGTPPLTVTSNTRVSNLNVSHANVSDFGVVTAQTTGTYYPTLVSSSATGNRALGANANLSFNVATGNLNTTLLNVTSNANAGNIGVSGIITAVGNVSGGNLTTAGVLSVTGNANVGNLGTTNGFFTDNITANNITSNNFANVNGNLNVSGLATLSSNANVTGNLNVAANANISLRLNVTGNANVGNIGATNGVFTTILGEGGNISNIQGGNVSGAVASATAATNASALLQNTSTATTVYPTFTTSSANGNSSAVINTNIRANLGNASITATTFVGSLSGAATSATTAGTVTTAAQPNITSVGTLTSLSVSGALTTTQITAGANTTAGTITGNWTLTSGSRLQATYADLAEYYEADATYESGTVLMFGGEKEVTLAEDGTNRVAGVVSTNPAYLMNTGCEGTTVAIALQGRVPCKVRGKISKGDMLVSGGNGFARPNQFPTIGTVIGKALENFDGYEGVIEVAVGRL